MNSTKETWDDILQQCRTWIQVTVAKLWYYTFNNSALQRRSRGRILPQRGFFYRENTCPEKHCTFLETCICPGCILKGKKKLRKSQDQKRFWLRPEYQACYTSSFCTLLPILLWAVQPFDPPPPSHNAENIWTHTFYTSLTNPLV